MSDAGIVRMAFPLVPAAAAAAVPHLLRREAVQYRGRWFNGTGFGLPDYMGDGRYGSGPGSALTVIGSLLSAALLELAAGAGAIIAADCR